MAIGGILSQLLTNCRSALVLGNTDLALDALVRAADLLLKDKEVVTMQELSAELADIEINASHFPSDSAGISGLIRLILWKKFNDPHAKDDLFRYYHPEAQFRSNVIILAGNSGMLNREQKKEGAPWIQELLTCFDGTVISGGTNSGIPGLTGKTARKLSEEDRKKFYLIGYLPENLPEGICRSPGYDQYFTSRAYKFSLEDVLNYWVDILFRKISPDHILLAGINGGPLSLFEYKLALAMGVKVALLKNSGGSVRKIQEDPFWSAKRNLVIVDHDGKIIP